MFISNRFNGYFHVYLGYFDGEKDATSLYNSGVKAHWHWKVHGKAKKCFVYAASAQQQTFAKEVIQYTLGLNLLIYTYFVILSLNSPLISLVFLHSFITVWGKSNENILFDFREL